MAEIVASSAAAKDFFPRFCCLVCGKKNGKKIKRRIHKKKEKKEDLEVKYIITQVLHQKQHFCLGWP